MTAGRSLALTGFGLGAMLAGFAGPEHAEHAIGLGVLLLGALALYAFLNRARVRDQRLRWGASRKLR